MTKEKISTNILTIGFGGAGFILAGLLPIISKFTNDTFPGVSIDLINSIFAACALFLLGCVGIIWVIRQEAPQIILMKGRSATLLGWLVALIFWGLALYKILEAGRILLNYF
jgi:hypothetical protein